MLQIFALVLSIGVNPTPTVPTKELGALLTRIADYSVASNVASVTRRAQSHSETLPLLSEMIYADPAVSALVTTCVRPLPQASNVLNNGSASPASIFINGLLKCARTHDCIFLVIHVYCAVRRERDCARWILQNIAC